MTKNVPVLSSENIRRIRAQLGESQSQFAKRFDVDTVTVGRWETGQRKCIGNYAITIARLDPTGNPLVQDFLDQHSVLKQFTERALKAILLAQAETHRLGHGFVGSEQLLLGLIGEKNGLAAQTLRSHGAEFKHATAEVEARNGRGPHTIIVEAPLSQSTKQMLDVTKDAARMHAILFQTPYTSNAAKIIAGAADEAKKRGQKEVGTGHILLSMLIADEGGSREILQQLNIDVGNVRLELERSLTKFALAEDRLPVSNEFKKHSVLSSINEPLARALESLEEARQIAFLWHENDLGIFLREREIEIWKKLALQKQQNANTLKQNSRT